MKKQNKISHKAISKVLKDDFNNNVTHIQWHGLDIEIKKELDFDDAVAFSNHICDLCFLESGEYVPEMFDFALRSCVIEYHTNVELSNDLDKRYEIVYRTDLYDEVSDKVESVQYYDLIDCAHDRVSRRLEIDEEDIKSRLTVIADKFDTLADEIASVYKDVDSDTLKTIANVASKMENVSEEDIVRAYSKEFFESGGKHE